MAMEIPHDIWVHIARFLPPSVLRDLLAVNKAFFEIGMDERYRRVVFDRTSRRMMKALAMGLLKDPNVAKRVHVLHIRPCLSLTSGILSPSTQFIPRALPSSSGPGRKVGAVSNAVDNVKAKIPPSRQSPNQPNDKLSNFRLNLAQAIDTIAYLSDVVEYVVESDPQVSEHSVPTFISVAASTFGQNLVKLSVGASLTELQLCASTSPPPQFNNLEELYVVFRTPRSTPAISYEPTAMAAVAAWFNGFASSLRVFAFKSFPSRDHDLSPFFRGLGYFPHLKELILAFPSDSETMSAPCTLENLLKNHRHSLRHLTLTSEVGFLTYLGTAPSHGEWLDIALAEANLVNLRSLTLSLCYFPAQLTTSIRSFGDTLTSLSLAGCCFTFAEVDTIVDAFANLGNNNGLKMLGVNVYILTPQLMDLLAAKLPSLQTLHFALNRVSGHEDYKRFLPDEFYQEMSHRSFVDWNISDIWISLGYRSHRTGDWQLMEKLAEYIPSIRSFGGEEDLGIIKRIVSGHLDPTGIISIL